ncbi:hypothetical protein KP509_06G017900 [Ceratopteris richardii]|uniref:Nrap protein domain-containing protein n=1 Tax=Ceratopteris richardii TaxID=49495 RepID=A0A8T2UID4_CERRI|nr:hypothetical protein KP509_06G017900 [Ceratopteris richardii]
MDGKINETAVWECDLTQHHLILPKIIEYLIRRHLFVSSSCIHVFGGQLDYARNWIMRSWMERKIHQIQFGEYCSLLMFYQNSYVPWMICP